MQELNIKKICLSWKAQEILEMSNWARGSKRNTNPSAIMIWSQMLVAQEPLITVWARVSALSRVLLNVT